VSRVLLAGSSWAASFLDALSAAGLGDGGGFALPDPRTDVPPPLLPWANVNQAKVVFGQDVVLTADTLHIGGTRAAAAYDVRGFAYDRDTRTATWTLAAPLRSDRLSLDLGSGAPWQANVLPGDANRTGRVDAFDLLTVRARLLSTAASPSSGARAYSVFCDLDGDGRITAMDYALARSRVASVLPPVQPAL
jgi:hypothetical protein